MFQLLGISREMLPMLNGIEGVPTVSSDVRGSSTYNAFEAVTTDLQLQGALPRKGIRLAYINVESSAAWT